MHHNNNKHCNLSLSLTLCVAEAGPPSVPFQHTHALLLSPFLVHTNAHAHAHTVTAARCSLTLLLSLSHSLFLSRSRNCSLYLGALFLCLTTASCDSFGLSPPLSLSNGFSFSFVYPFHFVILPSICRVFVVAAHTLYLSRSLAHTYTLTWLFRLGGC